MPPTDNSTSEDNFQELKPSNRALDLCGPCNPSDYGYNSIPLPIFTLDSLKLMDNDATGTTRKPSPENKRQRS